MHQLNACSRTIKTSMKSWVSVCSDPFNDGLYLCAITHPSDSFVRYTLEEINMLSMQQRF